MSKKRHDDEEPSENRPIDAEEAIASVRANGYWNNGHVRMELDFCEDPPAITVYVEGITELVTESIRPLEDWIEAYNERLAAQ